MFPLPSSPALPRFKIDPQTAPKVAHALSHRFNAVGVPLSVNGKFLFILGEHFAHNFLPRFSNRPNIFICWRWGVLLRLKVTGAAARVQGM